MTVYPERHPIMGSKERWRAKVNEHFDQQAGNVTTVIPIPASTSSTPRTVPRYLLSKISHSVRLDIIVISVIILIAVAYVWAQLK